MNTERLPRGPRGEINMDQVMREYEWGVGRYTGGHYSLLSPVEYATVVVCRAVLEAEPPYRVVIKPFRRNVS